MTRTIAMSRVTVLALMSAGHGADLDPDKVTRLYATHFRNTVIGGDKFWSNGDPGVADNDVLQDASGIL